MKELLHQHGLKNTPLRQAVLTLLNHHHVPLSADEISQAIHQVDFDRATLFRCLKSFIEAGLVDSVDLGEGYLRYERVCQVHHHHHHIICTECKKIEVVPVCIPPETIKYLKKKGYHSIKHRIDFSGLCQKCYQSAD